MNDFYIMQKKVDKSVLSQGMTIPQIFHEVFYDKIGFRLAHGESTQVPVDLNGSTFRVKLINQGFDLEKYKGHRDVLQLRYDSNKAFLQALRSSFPTTWAHVNEYAAEHKTMTGYKPPKEQEEYLSVYAINGSMLFECLPCNEFADGVREIKKIDELQFEIQTDSSAFIEERVGIKKIRHLSHSIGNSLKELYGYRCQICGEFIGEKYGSTLIHAHHIDYFTRSLNNDPENIMIVCPNHHGIIHSCNPIFSTADKTFRYENGFVEGLKLNKHI